ncbi:hypothetical protein K3495_g11277 [Podosphaera aphanis]|nr:hypothetical protein K3495_g11277 [Podosphaera aphanis]
MQEHIRRAHPEYYIPKLPATEESFQLMINSPPSNQQQTQYRSNPNTKDFEDEKKGSIMENSSSPNTPTNTPNTSEKYQSISMLPAAACAAAALAQLHSNMSDLDAVIEGDWHSDTETQKQPMRHSIELPPPQISNFEPTSDPFSHVNRRRELLPSILASSPAGRSSTLPPIQRNPTLNRPRKESVSKRAREPQHKRQRSRGETSRLWRMNSDRKAQSAEPSSGLPSTLGKRWEDLIDAATSANEDVYDERTLHKSNSSDESRIPSPISVHQASLPPFSASHFQRYQASPLQQTVTPLSNISRTPDIFSSMENGDTGDGFNHESRGHSDSSPSLMSQTIQIYCAACQGLSLLKESYVCTDCICGICESCVDILMVERGARKKCPKCATIGGRYKKINLDIR